MSEGAASHEASVVAVEDRRRPGAVGAVGAVAVAATAGLALGALTALGQGLLPPQVASLANSSGTWALVAFAVAVLAPSARWAACCGAAALGCLLLGYVGLNALRGLPSSSALLVFWGAAAVSVGPLLALGGYWLRWRRGLLAALGAGGMSGVLVGEGTYGLRYLAQSTYPPYWRASIAVGVLLLAASIGVKLRHPRDAGAAVLVAALVSVAFVLAYVGGGAVIGML